ncbi:MAG: hypothetical protein AAB478_04570 [Patescibacteria group bacterium]
MAQKKWSKAKKISFGWYPATWQGWLTLAIYLILEIKLAFIYSERLRDPLFNQTVSTVIFFFLTAVLTSILVLISYHRGEKASWRWPTSTRPKRGKGKKRK